MMALGVVPAFGVVLALALLPAPVSGQAGARLAAPPTTHPEIARADALYRQLQGVEGPDGVAAVEAILRILVPDDAGRPAPSAPAWGSLGAPMEAREAARLAANMRSAAGGTGGRGSGAASGANPGDPSLRFEGRWRAARLALGLGMTARTREAKAHWHRWGILWALEAVAAEAEQPGSGGARRGEGTEGLYWLVANLGRYGLTYPGLVEQGRAGLLAYRLAEQILTLDPDHAGAHNVMGRAYLELRRQNLLTRTLARGFVGGAFVTRASWEGAEHHLRRAVELDPGMLYFHLDLVQLHGARGDRRAARQARDALERRPDRHPIDGWIRARAREGVEGR